MSEDEALLFAFALLACLAGLGWWYGSLWFTPREPLPGRRTPRSLLIVTPLIALILLWTVLKLWSSHDVRDSFTYLLFYTVLGLAWCSLSSFVPAWLGISFRQDILGRANHAAGWATCGWVIGAMIAFAGGNIGDGPGWWVVAFSAVLSTGSLAVTLLAWNLVSNSLDAILIDRDVASGMRLAGLLVSCGTVFGVAAAGDWVSAEATVLEFFRRAWPAIPLFLLALALQGSLQPSPQSPRPSVWSTGILPLGLMCVMSVIWVAYAAPVAMGAAP